MAVVLVAWDSVVGVEADLNAVAVAVAVAGARDETAIRGENKDVKGAEAEAGAWAEEKGAGAWRDVKGAGAEATAFED